VDGGPAEGQTKGMSSLSPRRSHLSSLVASIRRELEKPGAADTTLVRALAETYLVYLARSRPDGARLQGLPAVLDGRVAKALQAMRAEPAKRWTVEGLAKTAGLSRAAFARQFRLHTGTSPRLYLARLRMKLAAELLLHSDAGLAEVAAGVGYDSEFAFSRAFKRHHGIAPGVFRRQARVTAGIVVRAAA
jgi:transcriptional regulator GlxA family with amidase domain